MGFFNRRQDKPDPHFPGLSRGRANELRRALRSGFTERGYDVAVSGDTVSITRQDHDADYTLDLGDLIHAVSRDDHADAVNRWTEAFIKAVVAVDTSAHFDTSNIYRGARVILLGDSADPHAPAGGRTGPGQAVLRPAATGLNVTLMLDTDEAVAPANVDQIARHDDLATIERAALNNLRVELDNLEVETAFQSDDDNVTGCWVLQAPGPYLAGAPLLMDEFIPRHLPDLDTDDGILFALPLPSVMFVREVGTGEDLAMAMQIIAEAVSLFSELAHTRDVLSPRVYLWHGGLIESVSSIAKDGGYVIEPNSYLLGRLHS